MSERMIGFMDKGFIPEIKECIHAEDVLRQSSITIEERANKRGVEQERSMAKTVSIFNTWTDNNLTEADGWRFMKCLKMARSIRGIDVLDDYVDEAAYTALLAECIFK